MHARAEGFDARSIVVCFVSDVVIKYQYLVDKSVTF